MSPATELLSFPRGPYFGICMGTLDRSLLRPCVPPVPVPVDRILQVMLPLHGYDLISKLTIARMWDKNPFCPSDVVSKPHTDLTGSCIYICSMHYEAMLWDRAWDPRPVWMDDVLARDAPGVSAEGVLVHNESIIVVNSWLSVGRVASGTPAWSANFCMPIIKRQPCKLR